MKQMTLVDSFVLQVSFYGRDGGIGSISVLVTSSASSSCGPILMTHVFKTHFCRILKCLFGHLLSWSVLLANCAKLEGLSRY